MGYLKEANMIVDEGTDISQKIGLAYCLMGGKLDEVLNSYANLEFSAAELKNITPQ